MTPRQALLPALLAVALLLIGCADSVAARIAQRQELFDAYPAEVQARIARGQIRPGADRAAGQTGLCGAGDTLRVARAALHHWEEPCLSGDPEAPTGSGTVFFSGCALGCCYCQNYGISQEGQGRPLTEARLAEIFL